MYFKVCYDNNYYFKGINLSILLKLGNLSPLVYDLVDFPKFGSNLELDRNTEYEKIRNNSSTRFESKSLFTKGAESDKCRILLAKLFENLMTTNGVEKINLTHVDPEQFEGKFSSSLIF